MRLLFCDTEFSDFIDQQLISIGLISEAADTEFYAERSDWHLYCEDASDFVKAEVLPLLGPVEKRLNIVEMGQHLHAWLSAQGQCAVVVDYSGDWILLVDAIAAAELAWPSNVFRKPVYIGEFAHDARYYNAREDHFRMAQKPPHNAMTDARALRRGWLGMPLRSRNLALEEYGIEQALECVSTPAP